MRPDREKDLTLDLLEAIEARSDVTQRHLADRLGVALGMTNAYLKRCVLKGLVKIQQAPANRYAYYLTPKGFAEKSRLTGEFLSASFDYYHRAATSIEESYDQIEISGDRRVLLAGVSEIAEIASVRAHQFEIELIGTVQPTEFKGAFLGRPVWSITEPIPDFDSILFTTLSDAQQFFNALVERFDPKPLVVPAVLQPLLENGPPLERRNDG
ncbi:MAG: winged helix-turn-helix transcriptional regulator [Pseudomonadota bacterium]